MKILSILSFLFILFSHSLIAQLDFEGQVQQQNLSDEFFNEVTFSNQNNLLSQLNFSSRLIVGVADMNGDKLDDIIRLEGARFLTIEYQSYGNTFLHFDFGNVSDSVQWSLAIADVDTNGFNDIILGGNNDSIKLLIANESGTDYTRSILPDSVFFAQGSNFVDIDIDGDADVFVCNDVGENRIWKNNGDGNFSIADTFIDMFAVFPDSANSGNYSSVWTDFDNDGDLDVYISKCSALAMFPTDVRRINQLFVNNNGTFTELADSFGLKIGAQSWTSDFQDIDNDGDMDCLVVNHYEPSQLLINDGNGFYTDSTVASGLNITTNHLQGQMRDFDNDGFVDILLAGNDGFEYYENNGDQTFTKITDLFEGYHMSTFAFGDLNHDGFLDIYSGSSLSTDVDVLWINSRNENHFFAVNLTGTESNINGIGARLNLYGPWGQQIREVRAGESYGIMNSFTQHFGLGTETTIDSLVIEWPSGQKEKFISPLADQVVNIVENECAYPDCNIFSDGITRFCSGDSVLLKAPAGNEYLWSNGEITQDIYITEGDTFTVMVSNDYGCSAISNPITIIQDPDETPQINTNTNTTFCSGNSVTLFCTAADSYLWSTGASSQSIIVFQSGTYSVTIQGLCNTFNSEPVETNVILYPENPIVQNDTLMEIPSSATLTADGEGDYFFWYDAPFDGNLVGTGSEFVTPPIIADTCFYVEAVNEQDSVFCRSDRVKVLAVVDTIVAIVSLRKNASFFVFPNPVNENLLIKRQIDGNSEITLGLSNVDGKLLKLVELDELSFSDRYELSLKDFPAGVYFLSIMAGDDYYVQKVVVQK